MNPLLVLLLFLSACLTLRLTGQELPVYPAGEPTDAEQLNLELMNRARAHPVEEGIRLAQSRDPYVQEGLRFFDVDVKLMKAEFVELLAKYKGPLPPLAMNGLLLQAARLHSADQFRREYQGHYGLKYDTNPVDRIKESLYPGTFRGENVFTACYSTSYGHDAMQVDWGIDMVEGTDPPVPVPGDRDGMQDGRKHRTFIHSEVRDVGVGIFLGKKIVFRGKDSHGENIEEIFGPQVLTHDFGNPTERLPRILGVAYYDLNGNRFYDPGEGIGGVRVDVPGANWRGVTSASGGYTVPVPRENTSREVRFTGLGFDETEQKTITGFQSVKVDLKPSYNPGPASGPLNPGLGAEVRYTFQGVPGAQYHQWRRAVKTPALPETADGGGARVTVDKAGTVYPEIHRGAWHLAHVLPGKQTLTFNESFLGGAAPVLQFDSCLAWATRIQHALAEISFNDGFSWTAVDFQQGSGGEGDTGFSLRTVVLTAAAGREFRLRFVYEYAGLPDDTAYIPGAEEGCGWYIDNITFKDISTLAEAAVENISAGERSFVFKAPKQGNTTCLLSFRPVISGRPFPFSPLLEVKPSLIIEEPPPPASYAAWASAQEKAAGLPAGALAQADSDFNQDGVANLLAYALNLSPVLAARTLLPAPYSAEGELRLDYTADASRKDVELRAFTSTDLKIWFQPGVSGALEGWRDELISREGNKEHRRAAVPMMPERPAYLRLRAAAK